MVDEVGGATGLLHGPREGVVRCLDRPVYVLLAGDLVAHFEAFVVEHVVRFFDLVRGVVDRHVCRLCCCDTDFAGYINGTGFDCRSFGWDRFVPQFIRTAREAVTRSVASKLMSIEQSEFGQVNSSTIFSISIIIIAHCSRSTAGLTFDFTNS